jgi:protein-disulfide isomerase
MGITGVPAFVIGDRGLVGAQPFDQLESFVSSAGAVRRES